MTRFKVDITGINTSNLKTLSKEKQLELFDLYKKGDKEARNKLIEGNLKFVLHILKRFQNKADNMDDLFQVGIIGLIKAIDNFDPSLGFAPCTYFYPLVAGEIKKYLRDSNFIRVCRSTKELAYEIIAYKEMYFEENGRYPTSSDIASYLKISEADESFALNSIKDVTSIFEPVYTDNGDEIYLFDQIADTSKIEQNDNIIALNKALKTISEREKEVLISRYVIGKTQEEISKKLNVSQAQVSRIEKNAIERVRKLVR